MSGIRTGTRLEQLQNLRRTVTVQIEALRRAGHPTTQHQALADRLDTEIARETPQTAPPAPQRRTTRPNRVDELLDDLGVTSHDVKVWAVQHGLLDEVRRGRLGLRYVEAYAIHHQLDEITRKAGVQ